jgi:acyl-CoA dehydrogenase
VIDGSKTFITNGYLAGLVLVVCKTDATQGARGTSILIVETEAATASASAACSTRSA